MSISKELSAFKKHFESNTKIKVYNTIEDRTFYHWKRLVLNSLNSKELMIISKYISINFSISNKHTQSVKLGVYNNQLVLTADVKIINEFILM